MGDTAETVTQKLSQHIDAAKEKLEGLKRDIVDMHKEDMETLRQRGSEMRARLDEQKSRAQELQAKLTNWRDEKRAHTLDAIASWQRQNEIEKLQKRADRAADYAADMVKVAADDFEEAEQAVLEAISARMEADQSLGASTR
jgi:predicted RNase H-like nuclease (RuvC/YqgF family)